MRRIIIGVITASLLTIGSLTGLLVQRATAGDGTVQVRIPVCEEDERYLKGKGDYSGGRWTRYVCVHTERVEGP